MANKKVRSHKYQVQFELLGRTIARERKGLGLTQPQLAGLAGCSLTFVNQLEQGKPTVRLDKLFSVLEVLALSVSVARGKDLLVVRSES